MWDFMQALKAWWVQSKVDEVIKNFAYAGEVPERTEVPFASIMPMTETPKVQTNKSFYPTFQFQIEVCHHPFEALGPLKEKIEDTVTYAPLNQFLTAMNSRYKLLKVNPPQVAYVEEDRYWRCVLTFEALLGRTLDPKPN